MDRKQIEELRVDIQNLMSNREKIDMPEGEPMYGISPYHIEKIQIGFNDLLLHIERLEAEKNLESVSAGLLRDEIVELESTLADAMGEMLLYLIEKGYVKVEELK